MIESLCAARMFPSHMKTIFKTCKSENFQLEVEKMIFWPPGIWRQFEGSREPFWKIQENLDIQSEKTFEMTWDSMVCTDRKPWS